jgi:hypothetical protein
MKEIKKLYYRAENGAGFLKEDGKPIRIFSEKKFVLRAHPLLDLRIFEVEVEGVVVQDEKYTFADKIISSRQLETDEFLYDFSFRKFAIEADWRGAIRVIPFLKKAEMLLAIEQIPYWET